MAVMPTSLAGLQYGNVFKPDLSIAPDYMAAFRDGQQAVQSVIDAQNQAQAFQQQQQARAVALDQAQKKAALDALLQPDIIAQSHAQTALDQARALDAQPLTEVFPNGGPNSQAFPPSSLPQNPSPANPQALTGGGFTSRGTGYHPVSPNSPDYKMEGGNVDALGRPIHTLDQFRRGEVPDVTVAIDRSSPLFGKFAFSPTLNAPVKFTDTGGAFRGKGMSRVDVARDTAAGANSDENNGPIRFTLGSTSGPASIPLASPVAQMVQPESRVSAPVQAPALAASPEIQDASPFAATLAQQQGHYQPDGRFMTSSKDRTYRAIPLVTDVKDEDGTVIGNMIGGKFVRTRAEPTSGKSYSPEALEQEIASKGGDATGLRDSGTFDRAEALRRLAAANTKAEAPPLLTEEAIEALAQQRLIDPTVNFSGMGKAAVAGRAAIENRIAEIQNSTGMTGADAVVARAGVTSAKAALKNQGKLRANVESFESTARKNADLALGLADKGGGSTGIPILNRWIMAGRQNVQGDPDVAAFHLAVGTLADEYAKVVVGGTGSTDAARRQAESRINEAGSPEQFKTVVATMKQEMANRLAAMNETEERLQQSIQNAAIPKKSSPTPPPAPAPTVNGSAGNADAVGTIRNQGGVRYQKQADGSWKQL